MNRRFFLKTLSTLAGACAASVPVVAAAKAEVLPETRRRYVLRFEGLGGFPHEWRHLQFNLFLTREDLLTARDRPEWLLDQVPVNTAAWSLRNPELYERVV